MSDALQRRIGLGVTLSADDASAGNYVALGSIVDGFKHGGAKAKVVDASIITDTYERVGKGQVNPGEITLMIAYDPTASTTTSARLKAMLAITGFDTGTNFKIVYPACGTENAAINKTFLGYVTQLGVEVDRGKMITMPVTIAVDGDPGF